MFASLRSKNGSTVIVRCRGHMAAMQRRDCELPSCLRTTHLTLEEAGTRYPSTSARTRTDDARHVQNAQMFADQRPAWLPLRALLFGPGCSMWRSRSIASSMISRLKLAQMEYRLGCSRELCHFEPLRGHNINRIDRPRHEKRDHTRNKYTEGYKEGSANRLRPQRHTTCSASGTRGRLHGNIPHAIFSLVSFRWARPICPAQVKSCHRPSITLALHSVRFWPRELGHWSLRKPSTKDFVQKAVNSMERTYTRRHWSHGFFSRSLACIRTLKYLTT